MLSPGGNAPGGDNDHAMPRFMGQGALAHDLKHMGADQGAGALGKHTGAELDD